MNYEQLKLKHTDSFEKLSPVIKEAANQIYKREFEVELDLIDDKDTLKIISDEEFPRVHIRFSTTALTKYQHLLSLELNLVLKLYARMIDAESDESVTDEHLEGLQEGVNQILGKIQATLENEENVVSVQELKVVLIESKEEAIAGLPTEGGLSVTYPISSEDEHFSIRHYTWINKELKGNPMVNGDELFQAEADSIDVHPAEFGAFSAGNNEKAHSQNMDMLMDVDLEILVELGRKTMLIKDVLKLGKGSIVELDKAAGEHLEVFINGRKFAEGEVVIVDDHFGIRITQLVGPSEKIMDLG
ncbi:MAG: flagellar motor switch protein FliN [Candidatus Hatepunaea meridiana]|nr:flagellar motor switch protein FliN [Candidatus Hatepunaea meridiana]